jgi:hypothetical protein
MSLRRCRYCQQVFQPAPYHPQQQVCSQPACQRQRQRDYHRRKIRSDPLYAQVVRESRKKWRDEHPGYQKRYRQTHPGAVERNRQRQHFRDQSRRLRSLVKNNLALDLRRCPSEVWLLGPAADELVKNNLAASQLLILQPVEPFPSVGHVSCKEHPSGLAGGCGL